MAKYQYVREDEAHTLISLEKNAPKQKVTFGEIVEIADGVYSASRLALAGFKKVVDIVEKAAEDVVDVVDETADEIEKELTDEEDETENTEDKADETEAGETENEENETQEDDTKKKGKKK